VVPKMKALWSEIVMHYMAMEIRHKNINGIELELVKKTTITDWWFGTFFIFPYIGNNDPD